MSVLSYGHSFSFSHAEDALLFHMVLICEHRGQKIIRGYAVSAICLSTAVKREHISKIPTSFVSTVLLASVSLVLLP